MLLCVAGRRSNVFKSSFAFMSQSYAEPVARIGKTRRLFAAGTTAD